MIQSTETQTQRQQLLIQILKVISHLNDANLHRVANFVEAIARQQSEKRRSRKQRFF